MTGPRATTVNMIRTINACRVINNPFLYVNSKDADQTARADPESFDRGGLTLTSFSLLLLLLLLGESEDPNTTISQLSSARQRNAIYMLEMAFRWRADVGSTLKAFQEFGPVMLRNPIFL